MKHLSLLTSLAAAALFALAAGAHADVITFEDLSGSGSLDSYHPFGINFEPGNWYYYDSAQQPYNPHSGVERTYQGSDLNPYVTFSSPVVFNGVWEAGYSFATAQLFLYDDMNTLVATSGILNGDATPQFLASGYSGLVSKVVISTPEPDFVVFDDFTLNASNTVPEPGTYAMMAAAGLSGMGLLLRRRSRK